MNIMRRTEYSSRENGIRGARSASRPASPILEDFGTLPLSGWRLQNEGVFYHQTVMGQRRAVERPHPVVVKQTVPVQVPAV